MRVTLWGLDETAWSSLSGSLGEYVECDFAMHDSRRVREQTRGYFRNRPAIKYSNNEPDRSRFLEASLYLFRNCIFSV